MMRRTLATIVLAGLAVLSGCSTKPLAPIRAEVTRTSEQAERDLEKLRLGEGREAQPSRNSERVQGVWLPVRKLEKVDRKEPVNEALATPFTMNRTFYSIQEIAERITLLTGIPVTIEPDVVTFLNQQNATANAAGGNPAAAAGMMQQANGLPPMPPPPGQTAVAGMYSVGNARPVTLSYNGPLSGFLDVAAARYAVSWEWFEGSIRVFRMQSKTFRLLALPGDTNLNAKIVSSSGGGATSGSSNGSGGSTSTSTQETGVSYSGLSVWKGIEASLKTMKSRDGDVTVTPATGTVTVTDIPSIVARMEKFIEQQNNGLARQVVINVRVLSVDLSDSDTYGISWDAVYSSLSGIFGFTFKNTFATDTAASNLTLKILSTAGQGTSSNAKAWAGSSALISALSKQGHVSQVTSASVTTLNNQVAPIQVGTQTSYLAQSTTTLSQGVSTTTLQPGLVTTGFSMNIVPHMVEQGRLLLQYAMDISELKKLATVSSGGSSIQTPEIDTRNFLQRVMVNSGDTLVVSGFEQVGLSASSQGMGDANQPALGGGISGSKSRAQLVILIQPIIVN